MKIKVKRAIREASELHGATATYVSLVDRGANETPFTLIKSAKHGVRAMAIKKRSAAPQTTTKSHKKVTTVPKTATTEAKSEKAIIKFSFAADNFADEQAVKDWLAKSDFAPEELVIKALDGGGFEALDGSLVDVTPERLGKVDLSEDDEDDAGVIAHIGEFITKADEPDDEDDEDADDADDGDDEDDADDEQKGYGGKKKPMKDEEKADDEEAKTETKAEAKPAKLSKRAEFIAKARETVVKFNSWDAFYSAKSDLSEALKAGMKWDATPPGFYDVQAAFNGVIQTIFANEEMDGGAKATALTKAATDFASILNGMNEFFDAYVDTPAETVAKTYESADGIAKLESWAKGFALFLSGEEAEQHTKAASKPLQSTATTPDVSVAVADIIAKALAPVAEQLEEVTKTVDSMAARRQTQKSSTPAPSNETKGKAQPEKQRKSTEEWLSDRAQRGIFG